VHYERAGQYDTALNLYYRALNGQMNNAAQKALILNNMANIRFRQGNFQKAVELWQAAVDAYPRYVATKYRLALALEKSGQTPEALVLLDEVLSKRPNYMDPLILKGTILLKQGHLTESISCFKKCLSQKPFAKKAILNIGIANNLLGRYGRAEWFFRILHHRYPQDRSLLIWLIETNLKSSDQADVDRYTVKLLRLIRVNELKSLVSTLNSVDLMSPEYRKAVRIQILRTLNEQTTDISLRSF
jgi:tetratricopeptide (TPR) repeat protein